jgi:hypothetical protein
MNANRIGQLGLFSVVVLLLGALLGACGIDSPTGETTSTAGGVVTVGTPTVGLKTCTSCHTDHTADWMLTKHANVEPPGNLYSAGNPTMGQVYTGGSLTNPVTAPAFCQKCHDPQIDSQQLVAGSTGNTARPVVGCESCHSGGRLHAAGAGPIGYAVYTAGVISGSTSSLYVSAQFATCTSCHELLDTNDPVNTKASPTHLTSAPTGSDFIITDTHFAEPGDWSGPGGASIKAITGYAMDYSSEKVCTNCHNPHKAPTQNREWAQSAHGDTNPYNLNATQSGYFSGAWAHYNWSLGTRIACQRCHTTTGFSVYADALQTGNLDLAAQIRAGVASPPPIAANAAFKPEMLKCNGCHTDNKGTLRNPGAITANYDYVSGGKTYARYSHAYPDLAGSNVCMACHTGLESGNTIKGLNDPALLTATSGSIYAFNFGNASFINSHYLTAGGQVFTVTGYEFDGRPYNNIPEYLHDKIGTSATVQLVPYVDTGSNGPCIGCHMSRPNKNGNHLFMPITRSTSSYGEVIGIASEMCMRCHGPSPTLILDLVKEQKKQFMEALEALKEQMAVKLQMYFFPYYPYWFRTSTYTATKTTCTENVPVKNWQTNGTGELTSAVTATMPTCSEIAGNNDGTVGTGQNNMGAAFNFNLLEHDPGAYVHNRMYAKRLIYDSIDWVDDGLMNYSVGKTHTDECAVTPPAWCAEAIIYLLPNGVLGIAAERP